MRAIFDRYDRNRNGRLDHAELREALKAFDSKEGRGLEVRYLVITPRRDGASRSHRNPRGWWLQPLCEGGCNPR